MAKFKDGDLVINKAAVSNMNLKNNILELATTDYGIVVGRCNFYTTLYNVRYAGRLEREKPYDLILINATDEDKYLIMDKIEAVFIENLQKRKFSKRISLQFEQFLIINKNYIRASFGLYEIEFKDRKFILKTSLSELVFEVFVVNSGLYILNYEFPMENNSVDLEIVETDTDEKILESIKEAFVQVINLIPK